MQTGNSARPLSALLRSEAADAAGVHPETVRYYEKIGLLASPLRDRSGYRRYGETELSRLSFISKLRKLGFSVSDIRSLLDGTSGSGMTCRSVAEIAEKHLTSVQKKVAELRDLEHALAALLDECSRKSVPECKLVERLTKSGTAVFDGEKLEQSGQT